MVLVCMEVSFTVAVLGLCHISQIGANIIIDTYTVVVDVMVSVLIAGTSYKRILLLLCKGLSYLSPCNRR